MSIERIKAALAEKGAWCGVCDYGETLCGDPHPEPCVECDRVRESYATAALGALQGEGDAIEAAQLEIHATKAAGKLGVTLEEAEAFARAAAPYLRAPLVARLAEVEGQLSALVKAGTAVLGCLGNDHAPRCPLNEFGPGVHRPEAECKCLSGPTVARFRALLKENET